MNVYMVHRRDAGVGYGTLRKSVDDGTTWSILCDLIPLYTEIPYFMHISDDGNAVLVGGNFGTANGTVVKSVNGGVSFSVVLNIAYGIFSGCKSPDSNTFWVGTYQGKVYRSVNNGDTWTLVGTPFGTNFYIEGISFISDLVGWLVGSNGKIFKTTNGGVDWTEQKDLGTVYPFRSVFAVSTTQVWALEGNSAGKLWKTIDGGTNWTGLTTPRVYAGGKLYAIGTEKVWFTGRSGANLELIRSVDGGSNFSMVAVVDTSAAGSETRIPVYFADENIGFIGFYRSWKTSDGGQTLSQGGICVDIAASAGIGSILAAPALLTQFRTFDITGSEPTDRTTQGSVVSGADPLNFGSASKGGDSSVKCIIFRVTNLGIYSTVSNMRFYIYDKSIFTDPTTVGYADITNTWTQNKTPAQVKAGTPGVCPTSLPGVANLTKIGGGNITGVGHADTSQYIYLVWAIGANETTGANKSLSYRVQFDYS